MPETRGPSRARTRVTKAHLGFRVSAFGFAPAERRGIVRLLSRVARAERCRARELNIVLAGSSEIRRLNRKYLKRNRVTDVISFPVSKQFLGEIYICRDQARRQAHEYRVTLREELFRLARHGLLHLLGYSHREMSGYEAKYGSRP